MRQAMGSQLTVPRCGGSDALVVTVAKVESQTKLRYVALNVLELFGLS